MTASEQTSTTDEAARQALARAEQGDGSNLERHLRGQRLRDGWLNAVGVQGKNGETWSVPGCPMAPECAPAYFDAIERMEQAEREGSGAAAMTAAFDLACHVLAEAYPLLTRRVAHDFVLDPAVCRRVIFASQRGQAPPLPRDEEVERIRPRVAWCIANKDKVGTVDAIAAVIVDGIPDAEPKPKSEGDAKN